MPSLLSGAKVLKGTTGSNSIFITLPTAQPSLGVTPTTGTGFTLVTGLDNQLGWTSTLGSIYFWEGLIRHQTPGKDLIIESNGSGTVLIRGNVVIENKSIVSTTGTFDVLNANTATVNDLIINRTINFSSATNTATFAGDVRILKDLRVDKQFNAYGNVSLNPAGGIVEIEPSGVGSISIIPGSTGRMDNMNIGDLLPANGRFVSLTATNLTVDNFTVTNSVATTGTFEYIRVLSTASDSVLVAGGMTVTTTLYAGEVYDSNIRVIRQINVGSGLSITTSSGVVDIANTDTLQSVTERGDSTTVPLRLLSSNASTSSLTGALQVSGGVGVQGSIYAASIYDNNKRVITSATVIAGIGLSGGGTITGPQTTIALTNTGVLSLTGGTDTAITTSTGNIQIWNTSNLQSITDRGNSTTNQLIINNTTPQVGSGTGALIVMGGAYIDKDLLVGGSFYANGQAVLTTASFASGLNSGTDIQVILNTETNVVTFNNTSTLQTVTGRGSTTTNIVHFANTSNSTSTQTGSLYASGGIGVAKDVFVGGAVYAQNGGSPYYNNQLYTPNVTVSTSTPVNARIGDFWIDPSIGVEFQYVPNGTQTVWIQFIGF